MTSSSNIATLLTLIGLAVVAILAIRSLFLGRKTITLLEEQAHAVQKLSGELFELQNAQSQLAHQLTDSAQSFPLLERELQELSAAIAKLRAVQGQNVADSSQLIGREIKRTLQSKEVHDFLASADAQQAQR